MLCRYSSQACSRSTSSHQAQTFPRRAGYLVEETDNLASDVLPPRLLVVHDARGGGEDDVTELTRGQELDDPLLEVAELDVVAGADDAGLVQAVTVISRCQGRISKGGV